MSFLTSLPSISKQAVNRNACVEHHTRVLCLDQTGHGGLLFVGVLVLALLPTATITTAKHRNTRPLHKRARKTVYRSCRIRARRAWRMDTRLGHARIEDSDAHWAQIHAAPTQCAGRRSRTSPGIETLAHQHRAADRAPDAITQSFGAPQSWQRPKSVVIRRARVAEIMSGSRKLGAELSRGADHAFECWDNFSPTACF